MKSRTEILKEIQEHKMKFGGRELALIQGEILLDIRELLEKLVGKDGVEQSIEHYETRGEDEKNTDSTVKSKTESKAN